MRFVARRVADPYTAADLTADVFLAVIGSVHTYRPGKGSPVAWLYGIARNVIAADRRRPHTSCRR
jgi:DNA-directed RNA polymerase specialized sigma24 family protein